MSAAAAESQHRESDFTHYRTRVRKLHGHEEGKLIDVKAHLGFESNAFRELNNVNEVICKPLV